MVLSSMELTRLLEDKITNKRLNYKSAHSVDDHFLKDIGKRWQLGNLLNNPGTKRSDNFDREITQQRSEPDAQTREDPPTGDQAGGHG